jgi:chromosomal replication initiation ATPase DnaA
MGESRIINGMEAKDKFEAILKVVCLQAGRSPQEVCGGGNSWALVAIRREFVRLARINGASFTQIGKMLNRHHTTIIHLLYTDGPKSTLEKIKRQCCKACGRPLPRGL